MSGIVDGEGAGIAGGGNGGKDGGRSGRSGKGCRDGKGCSDGKGCRVGKGNTYDIDDAYSTIVGELRQYRFGEIRRIVLSAAKTKGGVHKANARPVRLKQRNVWQLTKFDGAQAFHENIPDAEFGPRLAAFLAKFRFSEINALTDAKTIHFRITKRGKLQRDEHAVRGSAGKGAAGGGADRGASGGTDRDADRGVDSSADRGAGAAAGWKTSYLFGTAENSDGGSHAASDDSISHIEYADLSHNRQKRYILAEGMPIMPFVDLGIFDKNLRVIQSKYDKFRQINRFVEIIADAFKNVYGTNNINGDSNATDSALSIVEFGCGKSYLTFFIYYYFMYILKKNVDITGYDIKNDIVARCNDVAKKYGYSNLRFVAGDVSKITDVLPGAHISPVCRPDVMITLHACDTATDYALYYAIKNKVKYIFSVPCCQHEVNAQIRSEGNISLLFKHGLYKERFSALLTDSIRCEILKSTGYEVDVVEFVGLENTPKNAMIRATLKNKAAIASPAIAGIHACTNVDPAADRPTPIGIRDPAASVRALLSEYKIDQTLAKLVYNLSKDS
ncbi:MAG: SAM-dependent methyltransferase [Oscillospiraceae bacterium]|nr:SAM-dependent methyltransferase [Oscillospiraceae bacterium]